MTETTNVSSYRRKWRDTRNQVCHCCGRRTLFCWRCRCGFKICQECMQENSWAVTCNGITWVCPDCGQLNGFGNQ